MKPWEFEQLQPHEFMSMYEGYGWRREYQEDLLAYFVSNLMNIEGKCLKRSILPSELLSPLRKHSEEKNKEDEEQYLRETFGLSNY